MPAWLQDIEQPGAVRTLDRVIARIGRWRVGAVAWVLACVILWFPWRHAEGGIAFPQIAALGLGTAVAGLALNPNGGYLWGVARELAEPHTYVISAYKASARTRTQTSIAIEVKQRVTMTYASELTANACRRVHVPPSSFRLTVN